MHCALSFLNVEQAGRSLRLRCLPPAAPWATAGSRGGRRLVVGAQLRGVRPDDRGEQIHALPRVDLGDDRHSRAVAAAKRSSLGDGLGGLRQLDTQTTPLVPCVPRYKAEPLRAAANRLPRGPRGGCLVAEGLRFRSWTETTLGRTPGRGSKTSPATPRSTRRLCGTTCARRSERRRLAAGSDRVLVREPSARERDRVA